MSEVGRLQTWDEFGATVGVSGSTVRDYLYLTKLKQEVRDMFLALGLELPEGSIISKAGVRLLVKLPKRQQLREARLLIEKAGMSVEENINEGRN